MRSAHQSRLMQLVSVRSEWPVKARVLAPSQHSEFTSAASAAPQPAAFVSVVFIGRPARRWWCLPSASFLSSYSNFSNLPTDSLLNCSGSISPVDQLPLYHFHGFPTLLRHLLTSFSCFSPALFCFVFFFTLLHFPTSPHLLHPSTPAQLAKRRMSRQGVRLSCLSHAICGVTLRHSVTFSTLPPPPPPSSRDSESVKGLTQEERWFIETSHGGRGPWKVLGGMWKKTGWREGSREQSGNNRKWATARSSLLSWVYLVRGERSDGGEKKVKRWRRRPNPERDPYSLPNLPSSGYKRYWLSIQSTWFSVTVWCVIINLSD